MKRTVLAIDIGSTDIHAIVAEIDENNHAKILGHGTAKSQGIKKGAITNIELTSKSIKKAVADAKRIAGSNPTDAYVSISNAYAKSLTSTGVVNIPQKDISIKEINRAIHTALYNANIPNEYDVIHVLPYNFRVDEQEYIEDPFGMNAGRLEADVNIILTQKSSVANLTKAVRSAGLNIEGIVLSGYASAIAVMNEDEKELGAAVIDIGGQTCDLVVHAGNSVRYIDFLGVGSNHITNDLSIALHTPLQIAEEVKIQYGDLTASESDDVVELPVIGDEENRNTVSLDIIRKVIFVRVEEMLSILAASLEKSALREQISAGLILTGGMTKLKGTRELAQSIFHNMAVRIGLPNGVEGLFDELKDPAYAAAVGLIRYAAGDHTPYEVNFKQEMLHRKSVENDDLSDIRIASGTKEKRHDEPKEPDAFGNKEADEESDTLIFEDLPDTASSNSNPISKFINWAKQLF